jgi:tryptophan 2,3-dioxygenase
MTKPKLTYGSYLRVPELLALQQPEGVPPHHDEMLFIVIHQVHELWFKQLLHELGLVRAELLEGRALQAIKTFKRVHAIMRVLVEQIDVLETMTPQDFNAFRNLLKPASGFQSTQFREVEFMSGGGDPAVLAHKESDPGLAGIERRRREGTLYEALLTLLSRRGFEVPPALLAPGGARQPREDSPAVVEAFRRIYEHHETPAEFELYLLLEAFVDYDELVLHWRSRHVRMVERTIGMKQGTGGSSGASYLHRTLGGKFFPELWSVRTVLGQ